ncbi:MAG: hypothetical protein AUJ57_08065 [Zetaproteobacteria bacterium CG1_02_53_45]|nr:MAG: hypothetical protein AUJ57_08065 [Zetaproteobacteria bacterium CG1_02_53_45]
MKRIKSSFVAAFKLSNGVLPLLLAGIILPLLILTGFGIYYIFESGYVLLFVAFATVSSLLIILPVIWMNRKVAAKDQHISAESLVDASTDWGDHDIEVWESLNKQIQECLSENSEWDKLQDHALEIVVLSAKQYNRNEYNFSIPEGLKMAEEVCRRYRHILKTHVPFIEDIQLSYLKYGYDKSETLKAGKSAAVLAYHAYRLFRLGNPFVAIFSEVRGRLVGEAFDRVNAELQHKLKQALLQEVLSVAIDLYSGRFRVDDSEIESSSASKQDSSRMAAPLDPLRVCLIGQVSSGKSSVVNALTGSMVAEVNRLPSTDKVTIHECRLDGPDAAALHLVDLPGLDGNEQTGKELLEQLTNSDLVLWVLKANQPARELDIEFRKLIDKFYSAGKNRSRKRPAIIGLLNQVDRLKPVSDWNPPYDLENPMSNKGKAIKAAIDYNRELLAVPTLLPLCIADGKLNFNLDALKELLDKNFNEGIQAQLNRRRIEAGDKFKIAEQIRRLGQTGKSLFKMTVDSKRIGN